MKIEELGLVFFKGWRDDTLTFFARNSEGLGLTNLRGFSLNFHNNKQI